MDVSERNERRHPKGRRSIERTFPTFTPLEKSDSGGGAPSAEPEGALYYSITAKQSMLSVQYRLRLEFICKRIVQNEEVQLEDMIWANKLAKANRSAAEMMRKARRVAANPDMQEGGLDDFLNRLDLGDPDPSNHVVDGFNTVEEMVSWFKQDKTDDWRQRD